MTIFDVLSMIGGLSLFMFGMNIMGEALEKKAGGKLKHFLEALSSNKIKGFLLGLGVTAVIQSSSATTVMVVGFVNSGVMSLKQAINIIMGANVGTTVTAWILSLTGIEGDSLFMQLLKPTSFTPILALIGIALHMFSKKQSKKDIGTILLGFAVLMFGMDTMSSAVKPLAEMEGFRNLLMMFSNPILGVVAGAVITGIIQSSSASVGILQAFAATGQVSMGSAIPIIMGQNIGTTVTALISCTGTTKSAKRAAFVHLYFNLLGTAVVLCVFYGLNAIFHFAILDMAASELTIAIAHTAFNVVCTALWLPFSGVLERLAYATVKGEDENTDEQVEQIDERLLVTPSIALEQCRLRVCDMALLCQEGMEKSMQLLWKYDEKVAKDVRIIEKRADKYEDMLGNYMVQLAARSMTEEESNESIKLLHIIGDLERISDHATNIVEVAEEMLEKKITFSGTAKKELETLCKAVHHIVGITVDVCMGNDAERALDIEPLEEVIDAIRDKTRMRHMQRVQDGACTIELGFVYSDLLVNLERVSDHCSNIGGCMIEMEAAGPGVHKHLSGLRDKSNQSFVKKYEAYAKEYKLAEL
ncbi:MAG: Na/Pi cotransporter family protein [Lachnospiraceae bacterium]|nr:Na/Pi cotransporter family protein [Lachnospiraceae bacterium]